MEPIIELGGYVQFVDSGVTNGINNIDVDTLSMSGIGTLDKTGMAIFINPTSKLFEIDLTSINQ
jgi:hypothetical protein